MALIDRHVITIQELAQQAFSGINFDNCSDGDVINVFADLIRDVASGKYYILDSIKPNDLAQVGGNPTAWPKQQREDFISNASRETAVAEWMEG